jgi:pseudouridylate synthase
MFGKAETLAIGKAERGHVIGGGSSGTAHLYERTGLYVSPEIRAQLDAGGPIVALESTVIAHGLPRPRNIEVALELESIVRESGAVPATIGVIQGRPTIGLTKSEIGLLAADATVEKLSTRDLPVAVGSRLNGATTVASTSFLAARAGIEVFATGGIGGVHRGTPLDASADLTELHRTSLIVVCAGAKSILDLPATRELLETLGVLTLGWKTEHFPGFYAVESGESVDRRVDEVSEVAAIWKAHRGLSLPGSVLVCVPVPVDDAIPRGDIDTAIGQALHDASEDGIRGKAVTPYLLHRIAEESGGASLETNVALLRNNARIASKIAVAVAER